MEIYIIPSPQELQISSTVPYQDCSVLARRTCLSLERRTSGDTLFKGQAGTVRATDPCMFLGMSPHSCIFSSLLSYFLYLYTSCHQRWSCSLCLTQQKGNLMPWRPPVPALLPSFLMETHQPASSNEAKACRNAGFELFAYILFAHTQVFFSFCKGSLCSLIMQEQSGVAVFRHQSLSAKSVPALQVEGQRQHHTMEPASCR